MNRIANDRRGQRGYNLVEVLIAMALLGTVILSISTLFYMGRRNVYSGKQMTKVSAVATRVMEDLSAMSADDVLTNFNIPSNATLGTNTVAGTTYAGSIVRRTSSFTATNDPGGYLAQWVALLGSQEMSAGNVTLIITPANPSDATDVIDTAQTIRVRAVVEWREERRRRNAVYESSKLRRPVTNLTN
ncbi:MAG TPA: type II secretion system protein [Thermoanaerobaculia bacterium]|jgi:prepilin-type N-terminal cleavage/methylation domain-containing protein|nr:type II secretion system protein [Thermoanaerobaculia bacterium]